MGVWSELSTEFKQKSKRAVKVTPYEKKTLARLKKGSKKLSKHAQGIDFRNAVHGKPRKKKEIDYDKLKKQLKGKKGRIIIIKA